jgi:hypothetical protein
MAAMDPSAPVRDLAARIGELRGMDTVDTCRFRLVALRTRIESNWPAAGGGLFRRQKGLARDSELTIWDLLVALPTPLPLAPGEPPVTLIVDGDMDLQAVAGRAVDAAFALLAGNSLDAISELLDAQPTPLPPTAKASAGQGAEPVSPARKRLPRVRP